MPRLKGSADLLEDGRRRALALWDTGLSRPSNSGTHEDASIKSCPKTSK
jgi:hypothetical protein